MQEPIERPIVREYELMTVLIMQRIEREEKPSKANTGREKQQPELTSRNVLRMEQ